MRNLMSRLRQALRFIPGARLDVNLELTSQAEKDRVAKQLADQKIRFERMGLEVEVRQSSTTARHRQGAAK